MNVLSQGTVLSNRYEIKEHIGGGGMGQVYLALDLRLANYVAIKNMYLSSELNQAHTDEEAKKKDTNSKRAFEREAKLLSRLRHPALPLVTDYFTEENNHYLVMDYIKGSDLWQMMCKNQEFTIEEILDYADQLLEVLDYLHTSQEEPIVHRDIKPQNIKPNENGKLMLLDFGCAKANFHTLTTPATGGSVFGATPQYAPLEQLLQLINEQDKEFFAAYNQENLSQLLEQGTDCRSDIYSLGAMLYHLLTKQPPLTSVYRAALVWAGKPDILKPANTINPKIPAEISHILHWAMALDPKQRPQTAKAMRKALADARNLSNQQIVANNLTNDETTDIKPEKDKQDTRENDESENDKEARLLHEAIKRKNLERLQNQSLSGLTDQGENQQTVKPYKTSVFDTIQYTIKTVEAKPSSNKIPSFTVTNPPKQRNFKKIGLAMFTGILLLAIVTSAVLLVRKAISNNAVNNIEDQNQQVNSTPLPSPDSELTNQNQNSNTNTQITPTPTPRSTPSPTPTPTPTLTPNPYLHELINTESLKARADGLAVEVMNAPGSKGVITVVSGTQSNPRFIERVRNFLRDYMFRTMNRDPKLFIIQIRQGEDVGYSVDFQKRSD